MGFKENGIDFDGSTIKGQEQLLLQKQADNQRVSELQQQLQSQQDAEQEAYKDDVADAKHNHWTKPKRPAQKDKKTLHKLAVAEMKKGERPKVTDDAVKAWKKKVIDRLRATGHEPEAKYLEADHWADSADLSNDDAFGRVWGETAKGPDGKLLSGKGEYSYLWDGGVAGSGKKATNKSLGGALQGLMNDATYQSKASTMRPGRPPGSTGLDENYAVWTQKNHLIKVTYNNGEVHYMPSDDTNKHALNMPDGSSELSYHAATAYGSSNMKDDLGELGDKNTAGYMTNDQWDFIGKNNLKLNGKYPNNAEDFKKACDQHKPPLTFTPPKSNDQAGGPKLGGGCNSVYWGPDLRLVGKAHPEAWDETGGSIDAGSTSVSGENCQLAGVNAPNNNGFYIATGADDTWVGDIG